MKILLRWRKGLSPDRFPLHFKNGHEELAFLNLSAKEDDSWRGGFGV
jgi:hypothetical protein